MSSANESPNEPSGVNRLDGWAASHPQYVAGVWAFFALTSAFFAVFADGDEPMLALKLALPLGWAFLAFREIRRYRTQQ